MNLDRGLIKRQAKELIKGKWPTLFVIWFVVSLCVGLFSGANAAATVARNPFSDFNSNYSDNYNNDNSDENYFDDFEFSQEAQDFNNFGVVANDEAVIEPAGKYVIGEDLNNYTFSVGSNVGSFLALILAPLSITLSAFFVQFIRGNEMTSATVLSSFSRALLIKPTVKSLCFSFLWACSHSFGVFFSLFRDLFTSTVCALLRRFCATIQTLAQWRRLGSARK